MASRLLRVNLLAPITGHVTHFLFLPPSDHNVLLSSVQSSIDARLDAVQGNIETLEKII